MEKGILINSLPDIASHRLAFWQLAFLQIELYYSVFLSFGFLFSQPFGRYSSIYLIFCQSAFYHLAFLTVSHLYSQRSMYLAFYSFSLPYSQTCISSLIDSVKYWNARGASNHSELSGKNISSSLSCQPQQIQNGQFENSIKSLKTK